MSKNRYLNAKEAAERLGVNPTTLYAYVSKGLIRSEAIGGSRRERRYLAEDVQRLMERKAVRQNPARAVQDALHWGTPVLESALTLITETELYYRGQDACDLAQTHTLEEVAALLWTDSIDEARTLFSAPPRLLPMMMPPVLPITSMQIMLALASEQDLGAYSLTPDGIIQTGMRILWLLTYAITNDVTPEPTIAETLARTWKVEEIGLLDATLILCADHELNVSSFTARVIASAEANPYAVVAGGLAALQGMRHGGHTRRVVALLKEIREPGDVHLAVRERLLRGEAIPGFGHRLYPHGDPRATLLMDLIRKAKINPQRYKQAKAVADETQRTIGEAPTIDFALATLEIVLGLPTDSGLAIFALGRSVGWIGHAIEQYSTGQLIRPRARYTGRWVGEGDGE